MNILESLRNIWHQHSDIRCLDSIPLTPDNLAAGKFRKVWNHWIIEQSFFTTDYASNIYDRPHISAALSIAVTDWQVVGQQGKLMRLVKGSLFSYLLFMVYVSASSMVFDVQCSAQWECFLLRLAWQSWPNLKTSPPQAQQLKESVPKAELQVNTRQHRKHRKQIVKC